ncbi:MAG: 1-acyl-sn-glycerol-3-phosphate acyltransferase [Balneolaceae bacterium]|nr:MAG: 1-acyl-sn-glycerol-3-phosphate acyltransferase [Balneolaceae bacterium]
MKSLKALLKMVAVVVHTLACYLVYFTVFLFLKLFRFPIEPWKNHLLKFWSAGVAFIFNMKIRVEGTPPKAPFFLVSNHVSYMDIVVFYNLLDATFVAKKEVKSWPFLGFMAITLNVIFIDRSRKRDVTRVNELQTQRLGPNQGIVLFPEGKTSDGSRILPLRSPLLESPAKSGVPIHYATVYYETDKNDVPAGESVCWHSDTPLHIHMYRLAQNRRIFCTVRFGDESVINEDRKELAGRLQEGMEKQFVPMNESNEN